MQQVSAFQNSLFISTQNTKKLNNFYYNSSKGKRTDLLNFQNDEDHNDSIKYTNERREITFHNFPLTEDINSQPTKKEKK